MDRGFRDWELNRRAGHDYELLPPEAAIDPSEDAVSINFAIVLRDQIAGFQCGSRVVRRAVIKMSRAGTNIRLVSRVFVARKEHGPDFHIFHRVWCRVFDRSLRGHLVAPSAHDTAKGSEHGRAARAVVRVRLAATR